MSLEEDWEKEKQYKKDAYYSDYRQYIANLSIHTYNQRLQILNFAVIISLALTASFYISLTDIYHGDYNITPFIVVLSSVFVTYIIKMLEIRNKEMKECLQDSLEKIYKKNMDEDPNMPNWDFTISDKANCLSYGKAIEWIFCLIYFLQGLSLGLWFYITFQFVVNNLFFSLVQIVPLIIVVLSVVFFTTNLKYKHNHLLEKIEIYRKEKGEEKDKQVQSHSLQEEFAYLAIVLCLGAMLMIFIALSTELSSPDKTRIKVTEKSIFFPSKYELEIESRPRPNSSEGE